MNFLKKISLITYLELGLLIFTSVYNFNLFNTVKIVGNGASRTLVSVGPLLNIGVPYKDLYEFAPPGYFMMVAAWVKVIGLNMVSFRLLQAFLIFIHGLCILLISKKITSSKLISGIIFTFTILVAHSRLVQSDIYSVDLAATTFALLGLTSILYIKNTTLKLLAGSTFMIVAFQMKDIYILTIFTLIPLYFKEFIKNTEIEFYKRTIKSLLGVFSVLGAIAIYLQTYKIFPSYVVVFKDKMGVAHHYLSITDYLQTNKVMFTYFEKYFANNAIAIGIIFLCISLIIIISQHLKSSLVLKGWKKRFRFQFITAANWLEDYSQTISGARAATLFFVASLLGGLTLYSQYSVDTRFIPITTCLYILLGILITTPLEYLGRFTNFKFTLALLSMAAMITVYPKISVISQYLKPVDSPPNYNFEVEKYIDSRTSSNDCILHIYGWEVSSTYIYTQRRPCTKYFLINHLTLFGKRRLVKEYQREIFDNPPKALIINRLGADFNIENFESKVLRIPDITKNCYTIDPKYQNYKGAFFAPVDIYWPKSNLSNEDLKKCIYKYGRVEYN